MDNEQCQTCVQEKKKRAHTHTKRNTQMPHIYIYIYKYIYISFLTYGLYLLKGEAINGFKKINCLIKNFIVYLLKCEIKLDIFLFFF